MNLDERWCEGPTCRPSAVAQHCRAPRSQLGWQEEFTLHEDVVLQVLQLCICMSMSCSVCAHHVQLVLQTIAQCHCKSWCWFKRNSVVSGVHRAPTLGDWSSHTGLEKKLRRRMAMITPLLLGAWEVSGLHHQAVDFIEMGAPSACRVSHVQKLVQPGISDACSASAP